jgi:hypothetical protein
MITLETEDVYCRLTRGRQLPAVLVGELPRRTGGGTAGAARYIPLTARCNRFRESQRDGPGTQCSGPGVGDAHVYLEEVTSGIGRCCRATVRRVCLIAQQYAGQQYSELD